MGSNDMQSNALKSIDKALSEAHSTEAALREQILAQMAATAAMNADAITRMLRSTNLESDDRMLLRQLAIHVENASHCIDMLRR